MTADEFVKESIMNGMLNNGLNTVSIMLNGRYLDYTGKRLYVELCMKGDQVWLRWFITRHDGEADKAYVPSKYTEISDAISGNSLFGVSIIHKQDPHEAVIRVKPEYGVIVIQSQLYRIAEALQDKGVNVTAVVGGGELAHDELVALRSVFFEESLINYKNVVYPNGANRFARRLLNRGKFYAVKPESFVPVFIEVDWLYNPLKRADLGIKNTKMYRMAVEKGRLLSHDEVSAYLLTHKEICEAFGMTHFARFSPSLWFDLLIGLLQPNNPYFPNKVSKVYHWEGEDNPPFNLKRDYSEEEFDKVMSEKGESLSEEEFAMYNRVDSIVAYVLKNAGKIRTIGPVYLDERAKTTPIALQEYYKEAKLLFGSSEG